MTEEDMFDRLVFVAEWQPDEVQRLRETCADMGLTSPADILAFAQKVLDNQCLSSLRGGDEALDAMVAKAFRRNSQELAPEGRSK